MVVALVVASACGRSRRDEPGGRSGGGGNEATSGRGGAGGRAGSVGTGGVAHSGNGGAEPDPGSGGCSDTHADCACDSTAPECAGVAAELCPFRVGSCPPTLSDARNPSNWEGLTMVQAQYYECTGGAHRIEAVDFEGGYSLAFDAEGRLAYAAGHESCNHPHCGDALVSLDCVGCLLAPVDHFRTAGEGGQAGESSEPIVYPPCEIDGNGAIVMPAR